MATVQSDFSPRQMLQKKYHSARVDLLLILILTVVNVIILIAGGNSMFLFSISVPYYAVVLGYVMADTAMVTTGCIIATLILAVYLLCWIFSKNRTGWLVAALVLFVIDTLVMGLVYLQAGEISGIMDVLIHALVLFDLSRGLLSANKLKKMPLETLQQAAAEAEQQDLPQHSSPLRRADEEVKSRVLLEGSYGGHRVVYRRVKRVNELVIDGYVYDEYSARIEMAHCLSARIDGHTISVGFDGSSSSYMTVDGQQLKKKIRLV